MDDGPYRDGYDKVFSVSPVALLAATVPAVAGAPMGMVDKRKQRGEIGRGLEIDASSLAAVSPVRAALGHVRLTTERDCPRAPIASLDVDLGLVDEL
jgi:hypothetical protein